MEEFEDYIKEKKTIDLVKANIQAILWSIPITVLYFVPFYFVWKEKFTLKYFKENFKGIDFASYNFKIIFISFIVMTLGIILHELIHGLTWSIFAKNGFKSMKFGVLLKMLTPYCHCKEPLRVREYVIGAIMPSIVLGLIPSVLALILGNVMLLIFGTFFTMAAFGDFMIINLLKNENKDSFVLDHPSEAGCFIFRTKK